MINCGHVYHLRLAIAGKDKLLVPAFIAADGKVRFFVINSERTGFQIAKTPEHVLQLLQNRNQSFLNHDSWLVCSELVGGWTVDEMQAIQGCHRGPIDNATIAAVRALIENSKLHSAADKTAILAQWPT